MAFRCPFKNNAGAGINCELVLCGGYNARLADCNFLIKVRKEVQLLGLVVPNTNTYSSSSSSSSSSSFSSSSSSFSSSSSSASSDSSSSSSSSFSSSSSSNSSSSASGYIEP